jgi:hypothetical protein
MLIAIVTLSITFLATQWHIRKNCDECGYYQRFPMSRNRQFLAYSLKIGLYALPVMLAMATPFPIKQALLALVGLTMVSFAAEAKPARLRILMDCAAKYGERSREFKVASIFHFFTSTAALVILECIMAGGVVCLYFKSEGGKPNNDFIAVNVFFLIMGLCFVGLTYLVNIGFYRRTLQELGASDKEQKE